MQITKIQASNFFCLSNFKVDKLGGIVSITGGNGVGKSAVRKMIEAALKGKGITPNVIKYGEEKAEILIEIDHTLLVERKITPSGNEVKVTDDGAPVKKAQAFLDDLLGKHYIFSPPRFLLADKKKRAEMLLSAIPININQDKLRELLGDAASLIDWGKVDFTEHALTVLKNIKDNVYDRRREQNVDNTRVKKSIEQDRSELPKTINADKFADFDVNGKTEELSAAQVEIKGNERDIRDLASLRARDSEIEQELQEMRSRIEALEKSRKDLVAHGKALASKVDSFVTPDVRAMKEELALYHEAQAYIGRLKDIKRRQAGLVEAEANHKALDELHKMLAGEVPQRMLHEAELPIEGLIIDGDDIKIKKMNVGDKEESIVSLDTLSTSEQAVAILEFAKMLCGELKVICFDRFESLDDGKQRAFLDTAKGDGYEYFISTVTDGPLSVNAEEEKPEPEKAKATGASF